MFKNKRKTSTDDSLKTNKVFSYHSSRNRTGQNTGRLQQQAETSRVKKPTTWFHTWLPIITIIIIAVSLLSLIVLGGAPRVRVIQSDGGIERQDTKAYESGLKAIWNQSINNLTKMTARTHDVRTTVLNDYPELADARIELPVIGRRPLVTVYTAQAAATLVNMTGAYYLSYNGKVLAPVDGDFRYTGSQELISIQDESGLQPKPGEFALNKDQMTTIRTYVMGLTENDVKIQKIVLPTEPNRVDMYPQNQSYFIKFSFLEDARQGVGAYLAASDSFTGSHKPQEYVDVRIPEKVFYK